MDLVTVDHLLTTTRSVRKRLDFDRAVEPEIIAQCLEIAIQAPTGSNAQNWHFMVITDAEKRAQVGELYRQSFSIYAKARGSASGSPKATQEQMARVADSADYLAERMGEVPVLVIPCYEGRTENATAMGMAGFYGSILPAAWSFMLALRARGLGSAWTTLHLRYEKEVAAILGIPDDVTQVALLPVAYFTGEDFKPAARMPSKEVTYWDGWGQKGK